MHFIRKLMRYIGTAALAVAFLSEMLELLWDVFGEARFERFFTAVGISSERLWMIPVFSLIGSVLAYAVQRMTMGR